MNVISTVLRRVSLHTAVSAMAIFAMVSHSAVAEAPFSFDTAPGRLPKDVVPVDYTIAVIPNVAKRTFSGKESISLQVRTATTRLVFNTLNITVRDAQLDGQPLKKVTTDNDAQLTTIELAAALPPGTHLLTLAYEGVMETRPQGMFVQAYNKVDGTHAVMLSTQMEATDARRMFPSWDEPSFRATFELTATVPVQWAAISNMPIAKRIVHGALATVTFQRSPRMPTYLVNFDAGDLKALHAEKDGIQFSVWAVEGHEQDGAVALSNAQQILADYNDYFGYKYPLPKLDSIAIPGGFAGAMENWGAITYTWQALLLSPSSSLSDRQEVYSVQAHEMAHQWNGDLVTMGWWDDLWLNESFASWRAAKETDSRNPSWKWWEEEDASKESAMHADAQTSSHPIQQHVVNEAEASSAFDPVITYNKGESVIRMLENYLGADTFRDGVRSFMKAHAFSNATTADLWQALGSVSHQDIARVAASWTEQAGFPVVKVSAQCAADGARTIALSQQRFLLRPDPHPSGAAPQWSVPLQVRSGTSSSIQTVLLTQDGQKVSAGTCKDALSVNANATGFFRAQYDAATLGENTAHFATTPDGDRIAILDDQWALVDAGMAELPSYLALASGMGQNLDVRAWEQITEALGTIEYAERGGKDHEAFTGYARSILKPPADHLGWDSQAGETPALQSLRRTLLHDLGFWGDRAVIAEAQKRFKTFLADRKSIKPDDQDLVLSIVGRYADAATFQQLLKLAQSSTDDAEQARFYSALAGAQDAKLAEQSAQIAVSKQLPPQQATLPLHMLALLHAEHANLAWTSFSEHQETLLAPFGNLAPLALAQQAPEIFWDSLPLPELETWIRAHVPASMDVNIQKGMMSARFKVSEKSALVPAMDAYLASHPHAG